MNNKLLEYKRVLLDVREEENILREYPEIQIRDYNEIFTMVIEDINLNNNPITTTVSVNLNNIISNISNIDKFMDTCNKVKYSLMNQLFNHQIPKGFYCETYHNHYLTLQYLSG